MWVMLITLLTYRGARRQIHEKMRREGNFLANLKALCAQEKLKSVPHGDSVDYLSLRMKPEELEEILVKMAQSLIRGRKLEKYRLLGKYYTVAIDGVHLHTFDYPHCPKCLVKEDKAGKKQWQHYLLQATLVTPEGLCLPLANEWIENESGFDKQDCERKACYRLLKKLRRYYPRLPMCILLDALYAAGPVFEALAEAKLEWITVFKSGSMPEVYAWVMEQKAGNPENNVIVRQVVKTIPLRQRRTHLERMKRSTPENRKRKVIRETTYTWSTEEHWNGKKYNILTCKDVTDGEKNCEYVWLASDGLKLSKNNVIELAEKGGRCRWKIENECFNVQKNGGYGLEHCYSRDEVSMKNWVTMLSIAYLINQLIAKGSLIRKSDYGGLGNMAQKMFEHFCYYLFQLPAQRPRIQIRLFPNTS